MACLCVVIVSSSQQLMQNRSIRNGIVTVALALDCDLLSCVDASNTSKNYEIKFAIGDEPICIVVGRWDFIDNMTQITTIDL